MFAMVTTSDLCVCLSSVRSSTRVKHFKIHQPDEGHFHVDNNHHFRSLIDLVEHYSTHSLSSSGPLGNPCRRVG